METYQIVSSIIGLIVLIVYFVMANNISDIKAEIKQFNLPRSTAEYWEAEYRKHSLCYRKEQALYALQEMIWFKVLTSYSHEKRITYDLLKANYEAEIIKMGGTFMEYKVENGVNA